MLLCLYTDGEVLLLAKNVVMKDIADALGVSVVSVSKALGGKEGLSDEVRRKILEKSDELGYKYDASKKKAAKDNFYIGILVSDKFFEENSFYTELYKQILLKSANEGMTCILEIVPKHAENKLIPANILSNENIDGIIIMGKLSSEYVKLISKQPQPYLLLDFYDDLHFSDSIISDGTFGTFQLTSDLIRKGHKNIAFVGNIHATSSIMDRYLGYIKALLEKGFVANPQMLINDRDELGNLIECTLPKVMPDAFVCNCDLVAYNLITQLKSIGVTVPDDVSVVGFDDSRYATLGEVGITTFNVNLSAMSTAAVNQIARKIKKKDFSLGRTVIAGKCIIRNSVKSR